MPVIGYIESSMAQKMPSIPIAQKEKSWSFYPCWLKSMNKSFPGEYEIKVSHFAIP